MQDRTGWCQLSLLPGEDARINVRESVSTAGHAQGFSKALLEVMTTGFPPGICQDTHHGGTPANPLPPQGLPIHKQAASLNDSEQ